MKIKDIAAYRLSNQKLINSEFTSPAGIAAWMAGMQGQDYVGVKWSVALRLKNNATHEDIEKAIAAKTLLRTWPMRGTLHLVASEDARWLLSLTSPRNIANSAHRRKALELDDATLDRCAEIFTENLVGGKCLVRDELYSILEKKGISTAGQRGYHILFNLALKGIICLSEPRGKEQGFSLLNEWAPNPKILGKDEALGELAKRYFSSRGPAKLEDFNWHSGLLASETRRGIEVAGAKLKKVDIEGEDYYIAKDTPDEIPPIKEAFALPGFDEYLLGYKDRTAALDKNFSQAVCPGSNGVFIPTMAVGGKIAGIWKRETKKKIIRISTQHFYKLKNKDMMLFERAACKFGKYLGTPVEFKEAKE